MSSGVTSCFQHHYPLSTPISGTTGWIPPSSCTTTKTSCRKWKNHRQLFAFTNLEQELPAFSATMMDGTSGDNALMVETIQATTTTTNFEPVLDVPALATFLFVLVVFGALNYRTSQVQKAIEDRDYWLDQVRNIKSKELADGEEIDEKELQSALQNYESAILKEEQLRNLVPGGAVRIVPPTSPASREADEKAAAMAKQFLGKEYDIGRSKPEVEEGADSNGNNGNLPTIAVAILTIIALSQMGLFVFMNYLTDTDPTSTII